MHLLKIENQPAIHTLAMIRLDYYLSYIPIYTLQVMDILRCKTAIVYCSEMQNRQFPKKPNIFKMQLKRWNFLTEIGMILTVIDKAIVALQSPQLTLMEAFKIWTAATIRLSVLTESLEFAKPICKRLIDSMNERKPKVLGTPCMLSMIFLNERYFDQLSNAEKQTAKVHIVKIWLKISSYNAMVKRKEIEAKRNMISRSKIDELMSLNDDDLLMSNNNNDNDENSLISDVNQHTQTEILQDTISNELHTFVQNKRTSAGNAALSFSDFWKSKKDTYPSLYQVVQYLLIIPPSQVTVERNFSTLSFVLNMRRAQINEHLLESILLIKLNNDLMYSIYTKEIEELESK